MSQMKHVNLTNDQVVVLEASGKKMRGFWWLLVESPQRVKSESIQWSEESTFEKLGNL